MKKKKAKILLAALLLAVGETAFADGKAVSGIRQINPTTVEITYSDGGVMTVDFYGQNVFRLFRDPRVASFVIQLVILQHVFSSIIHVRTQDD